MGDANAVEKPGKPFAGTTQGIAQAAFVVLFMLVGSSMRMDWGATRSPAFWTITALVAGGLIGLGIAVDRRRSGRRLELVAPVLVRRVILVVAIGLPTLTVGTAVFAQLARGGDPLQALVCSLLPGMLILVPSILLVLDRIVGPGWVLVDNSIRALRRRRWSRCDVIEVEGERAFILDGSQRRSWVRTAIAMEPGPAYLVLTPMRMPAEPYREDDVRGTVEQVESADDRSARTRDIGTAALALVSGLAWLATPFTDVLGRALTV